MFDLNRLRYLYNSRQQIFIRGREYYIRGAVREVKLFQRFSSYEVAAVIQGTKLYKTIIKFDENNKYDEDFWSRDIINTLERIRICIKYGVFPYIMRFRMWNSAKFFRGMYVNLSAWCNQKSLFSKLSFNEWADKIQEGNEKQLKKKRLYSSKRYLMEYAGKFPDIAYEYFDLKYTEHNEYIYKKYEKYENKTVDNKRKQQKTIFSIEHNKDKIEIIKVDKTPEKKIVCSTIEQIKNFEGVNNDIDVLLKSFKNATQSFYSGIITIFSRPNLKLIPNKSISLITINLKEDEISEEDKNLLLNIQRYLKNDGSIVVFNNDLKSFTIIKEFIENNTNLKFQEVTTYKSGKNNKLIHYASRYISKDKEVKDLFVDKLVFSKTSLIELILKETTNETDLILGLFEQSSLIDCSNKNCNRKWICMRKKQMDATKPALKYISTQLYEEKQKQKTLFNQEIG
jgi:hypothetical protein